MTMLIFLAATLFIAALVNVFFHLYNKKFRAWFKSLFSNNSSQVSTPASVCTTTPHQASKKEKNFQEVGELRKVFSTFDKNGDGYITKKELRESLKNLRIFMTEQEVEEVFVKLDANGDGMIDIDEFCGLCKSMGAQGGGISDGGKGDEEEETKEVDLKEAFDVFDKDKDGLISVEELGFVLSSLGLHEGKREENCKEMIRKVDMDGDGMVNFHEFKEMMRSRDLLVSAH